MKVKELTNAPQWLIDAIVEDEDVVISESGRVTWCDGVWRGGEWCGGEWRSGVWRGGEWCGGVWRGERITKPLVSVSGLSHWSVTISDTRMQIGCELHSFAEWNEFDDARIVQMDRQALRFWREHKATLIALCATRAVQVSP